MRAILTYHSVDDSGSPISVGGEVFQAHRRWLASGGVRVLSLDEVVVANDDADAVAVTLDDGFLNTRAPIERMLGDGIPVTVFVVTQHVGAANNWGGRDAPGIPTLPLLGWNDLAHLADRGATTTMHTAAGRIDAPEASVEYPRMFWRNC